MQYKSCLTDEADLNDKYLYRGENGMLKLWMVAMDGGYIYALRTALKEEAGQEATVCVIMKRG
ncbi:MAG: hypothetical protein N2V77_03905 [Canidatus Methanoxibalbensis ujae]|nr:hypothetical protein [Candidatus Methanoxibalbensis ujae]